MVILLLIINAVIWCVFGVVMLVLGSDLYPGPNTVYFMAAASFFNAFVLSVAAWMISKNYRWALPFAATWLIVNAVVSIADEIGVVDVALFFFNLVILFLLFKNRAESHTIQPA